VGARLLVLAACLLAAPAASAGEITAFLSKATPDDVWAAGVGGAVSVSFFSVLSFEGEIARQSAEIEGHKLYSITGSVLVAPPTGRLVPYAGLGFGGFRQETGELSDNGTLSALIAGLKLKLGPVFLIKGEYRRIALSGEPLFEMDSRYSVGAGLSF
jgi:hypothetical protein